MSVEMKEIVFLAGIWGFLGLVFLIVGTAMLSNRNKKEKKCTQTTPGKVIDIAYHRSRNGGSWHPIFEYSIGELKFIKESHFGSSRSKYSIGQDVEICYDPDKPNKYYVAGDKNQKIISVAFTIAGAVMLAIAAAIVALRYFGVL